MNSGMYDSLSNLNDRMLALVNGVYTGIVTDNNDPEKLGRVKVKIPVLDDRNALDWARVAMLAAGQDRGTVFIPDVGDEVLVAFLLGDVRQPVVIGALWNSQKKPPASPRNDRAPYKIRSRSGHELMLDDDNSDGKIVLRTKGGQQLELSDKGSAVQLRNKNGHTITIKGGSNEIEIKCGGSKVTLNNSGVSIESTSSLKVKATNISIQANAKLDLRAPTVNLNADALLTLKGSMVKIN